MSGTVTPTKVVTASGDARIDGVLTTVAWDGPVYFSFPTTNASYSYTDLSVTDLPANFVPVTAAQQANVRFALNGDGGPAEALAFSVAGFTNLTVLEDLTPDSNDTIRVANTDSATLGTAQVADFPGNQITTDLSDNGDVWFGNTYDGTSNSYKTPQAGNYAWATHLHELGHALGLSHGHSTFEMGVTLPAQYDAMEFSIMTYRSYVGASTSGSYTNEQWGYAQTFMMSDIAALQYMYGADFTTNSGDTVYTWTPGSGDTVIDGVVVISPGANRIFATIWDGGGTDTYDLSAYVTDLQIDLSAGGFSLFSAVQQANLGGSNFASGNIYNALQYQGDKRSLIENAIGGTGNDTIEGNQVGNKFWGGLGNDYLDGKSGKDVLRGEGGNDTLLGGAKDDRLYGGLGRDTLEGGSGNDTLYGGKGRDRLEGGGDDDMLFGLNSNDNLYGEAGADTLDGGIGNDRLTGGKNADVFIFENGFGHDTITDFAATNNSEDIDLSAVSSIIDFSDLKNNHMNQVGMDVVIDDGSGNTITLLGVDINDLHFQDFIF